MASTSRTTSENLPVIAVGCSLASNAQRSPGYGLQTLPSDRPPAAQTDPERIFRSADYRSSNVTEEAMEPAKSARVEFAIGGVPDFLQYVIDPLNIDVLHRAPLSTPLRQLSAESNSTVSARHRRRRAVTSCSARAQSSSANPSVRPPASQYE